MKKEKGLNPTSQNSIHHLGPSTIDAIIIRNMSDLVDHDNGHFTA